MFEDCDYPCEICGNDIGNCVCPECPVCGVIGDPACYDSSQMDSRRTRANGELPAGSHGMIETNEQIECAAYNEHINSDAVMFAPDWEGKCIVCEQSPTVPITGLCGPCTFGEADTAGGNW